MRATLQLHKSTIAVLSSLAMLIGASVSLAQTSSPDAEMLTLVVGTHFVTQTVGEKSPRAQFNDERVPLSAFNATDHCIDQRALELAREYFDALGRALEKAAYYYFIPDDDIGASVENCEKLHGGPPHAWVEKKTKIIAFGKVVPTTEAPAIEESLR